MDRRTAESLTRLVEGGWSQKLGEAKLSALTEWFARSEASEDQCRAAVHKLMDSDEFPPTPKKIHDTLKAAGAVGPPTFGTGDPRVLTAIRESLLAAAGNTSRVRHIELREALLLIRDTTKAILADVSAMGDDESEERGYWNDRLTVLDQMLRGATA